MNNENLPPCASSQDLVRKPSLNELVTEVIYQQAEIRRTDDKHLVLWNSRFRLQLVG